ncbi:hypothetical protein ACJ41O_004168 [Fusarium nematophilum]
MMRSTVPRRAQARQKMFVRNTDKNGEIYYTLNRWGYAKPKVPKDHELFQINDLLLDLDDMDSQLGAVASLWQESRLSETKPEERARDGKLPVSEATLVSEAFQSAIRAALSVVALRSDAVPMDHDLAGCATLDLKSIKMQDHDARLGYQQEEVRPMREFVDGEIRAALDLPLNEWLEAVRRLAQ